MSHSEESLTVVCAYALNSSEYHSWSHRVALCQGARGQQCRLGGTLNDIDIVDISIFFQCLYRTWSEPEWFFVNFCAITNTMFEHNTFLSHWRMRHCPKRGTSTISRDGNVVLCGIITNEGIVGKRELRWKTKLWIYQSIYVLLLLYVYAHKDNAQQDLSIWWIRYERNLCDIYHRFLKRCCEALSGWLKPSPSWQWQYSLNLKMGKEMDRWCSWGGLLWRQEMAPTYHSKGHHPKSCLHLNLFKS